MTHSSDHRSPPRPAPSFLSGVRVEHLEAGVRVYHMYGLTEMSVWQTMTRLDTRALAAMPVLVRGHNLLSGQD